MTETELNGVVNAGTAHYLARALDRTASDGCRAMLVRVDTPGGTLDATREIVGAFLQSRVPVVAHVAPDGARAGSAGMFIVLAAHVAAMAPGTNIGAAHPVMIGGGGAQEMDPAMEDKVVNDTAAFARAIAERRDRNLEWAEDAVRKSKSATASEALDKGVIDLTATSTADLIAQVDGRSVRLDGGTVTLSVEGAERRAVPMTVQERALSVLGNPSLAYLLFVVGLLFLSLEIYTPGTFFFGGVGLFLLMLAAIGMNMLPVNAAGVVLIIVAVALFVAEFFIVSHGLLALAGAACLVVGSLLLFDATDEDFFADASVRLSWGLVAPLAVVIGGGAMALSFYAAKSTRRAGPLHGGGLVGLEGQAVTPIREGSGQVKIRGEYWSAFSDEPIPAGARVSVLRASGLTLQVVECPPRSTVAGSSTEEGQ